MSESSGILQVLGGMTLLSVVIFILFIWDVVWKAIAMWHAARRGDKGWYILILIINSIGILPIIYYFAIAKRKKEIGTNNQIDA